MDIRTADPSEIIAEQPTLYHVYFWANKRLFSDEYELSDARNVYDVLAWAHENATGVDFELLTVTPGGHGAYIIGPLDHTLEMDADELLHRRALTTVSLKRPLPITDAPNMQIRGVDPREIIEEEPTDYHVYFRSQWRQFCENSELSNANSVFEVLAWANDNAAGRDVEILTVTPSRHGAYIIGPLDLPPSA